MVPHLPRGNGQGRGFKGAALYYLHDKNAETCERVGDTATFNLSTQDPDIAWKVMAATAMNQAEIKQAAGTKATGRKLANPVFAYSLSWSPDEQPDSEHMIAQAKHSLAALDLSENQALVVQHTDTEHPHVHILVNRVHPETGVAAKLKYTRQRLDRWAHAYEKKHGMKCRQRLKNEQEREKKRFARQQEVNAIQYERSQAILEAIRLIDQQRMSDLRNLQQRHQKEGMKLEKRHNRLMTRFMSKFDFRGKILERQEADRIALETQKRRERQNIVEAAKNKTQMRQEAIQAEYEVKIQAVRKTTDIQKNAERVQEISKELRSREQNHERYRVMSYEM